jgi:hypothetical protein
MLGTQAPGCGVERRGAGMSKYTPIHAFTGDWNNDSHGRRVKCPCCGDSFQAYIRIKDAVCGCGARMAVLTERAPSASVCTSGHGNSPRTDAQYRRGETANGTYP